VSYERLDEEAEREPRRVANHRDAWERLTPLPDVNGAVGGHLERFAADKGISLEALVALGTRVKVAGSGEVELAWGYPHNGAITAIKFRPLGDKKRYALEPSVFPSPLVIGRRDSLDWLITEGETDTCRLYDLVGDLAAILCLPAGARAFRPRWADAVPRGATVALAHDNDPDGDAGAEKAGRVLGGRTVRLRPPDGIKDWCSWPGSRDEFLELAAAARGTQKRFEFLTGADFLLREFPKAEPLYGAPGQIILAIGSLLMVYGADGSGKSTWSVDGMAHLAAGVDWLGIPVPRPVRFCVIENEGPPDLFQQKIAAKIDSWEGPQFAANLFFFVRPWGEFTFADPDCRRALTEFCDEHRIDVVTANPTLGLGAGASGRPDETQQFVDWLVESGLKSTRAYWLLHHENKAGQISGDWGRHPDTKVLLQQEGNHRRTKLTWAKTRWATLPTDTIAKASMLEWVIETQGYSVVELDPVGATDVELEQRIVDFLTDHPGSSTTTVETEVKGTSSRIRRLLEGPRFDCFPGPRGAKLWLLSTTPSASAENESTG
jgi:AAA domain